MAADSVNMSLDEIIQQSRNSRSRGRGHTIRGVAGRGRGGRGRGVNRGGRGGGIIRGTVRGGRGGRGGLNRSRSRSRARSQSRGRAASQVRSASNGRQNRSRSRQRGRSRSRGRSQSRSRSQLRSNSQMRSRSRAMTPRGRAGLDEDEAIPPLVRRGNRFNRGGQQNGFNARNSHLQNRLGFNTRPLAFAKVGITKRGRGVVTGNRYSNIGLRSDQIVNQQKQNYIQQKLNRVRRNQNNAVQGQIFTRSRNNSASRLTVSVKNDFQPRGINRRRNSAGNNPNYLNRQMLEQLNNSFGVANLPRGPGSVQSASSNRSRRSNVSNRSNNSNRSGRYRGRGRVGRVGQNFVQKQVLNPQLQQEIASIQRKTYGNVTPNEAPVGISFRPSPVSTSTTLHQRFALM